MLFTIMKKFDFSRFLDVARWDLYINRQAYVKYTSMVVGVYVLIAMYTYVTAYLGSDGNELLGYAFNDSIYSTGIAMTSCSLFTFQTLIVMNSMFHGIHTRQGRVNELTLPATNLEKFSWHVVRTLCFNFVTFVVGIWVADALHCLFVWGAYGFDTDISSITGHVFNAFSNFSQMLPDLHEEVSVALVMTVIAGNLLTYAFVSTFALGSAWKYRRSFATTILYHIVFWLVIVFVSMAMFAVLSPVFAEMGTDIFDFLAKSESWHWALLLLVFSVSVFVVIWYLTYRLYCNAQITTRRNP